MWCGVQPAICVKGTVHRLVCYISIERATSHHVLQHSSIICIPCVAGGGWELYTQRVISKRIRGDRIRGGLVVTLPYLPLPYINLYTFVTCINPQTVANPLLKNPKSRTLHGGPIGTVYVCVVVLLQDSHSFCKWSP